MNVLHIGMMRGGGFSRALKKNVDHLVEVATDDLEGIQKQLNYFYDLVFVQVQNETMGNRTSIDVLRPIIKQFYTINWSGDIRKTTPKWMIDLKAQITAFSNMRDVSYTRSRGLRSEFLQIGIDPKIYNTHGPKQSKAEIVFFANDYGNMFPLGGFRRDVVRTLKQRYGNRFGLYGNFPGADGNYNVQGGNPDDWQHKEAAIYRGAKIAISISHFHEPRYTSDRLLRALACGPAVMCHQYPDMEFDDRHLIKFQGVADLCQKIDKQLEMNTKLEGAQYVAEHYTFDNMAKNIITLR